MVRQAKRGRADRVKGICTAKKTCHDIACQRLARADTREWQTTLKEKVMQGKQYAGNPHVRFDEGEVAKRRSRNRTILAVALLALCGQAAGFEHCIYDSVSLDGAWEMAYQPYAWETVNEPVARGVRVENAVPGYWEDMTEAFRAAGMTNEFRINPWYSRQTFPVTGSADNTTLPQIYGCFIYRRRVTLDREDSAVLRFEGVRNQVHVWINGSFVGFRAGFSTPFEMPIPAGLLRKGENEIVLAVSNNPNLGWCDYVCGLTTRSVFRSTGGVNGHLDIRFPRNSLADVYVTTARDLKSFTVHVGDRGMGNRERFKWEIVRDESALAYGEADGDFTLPTEGFEFWSPEHPVRYTLCIKTPEGEYSQKFGIRRLVADGEKLRLNGRPVYMRGVTEHCYFPKTVHLPRDLDYYRMVTSKRKELGFNFVRFHTFVPPVEYLEATDELGMLVHIETPNFVPEPEFAAVIAFARSHPSAVIYCMGNETRIDRLAEAYLRDCADLVHSRTDALFSPMSAMRGCEYCLVPGKDVIAKSPFPHNPERLSRLAEFCDLFTSYQLGATSYYSLKCGSPETLDSWGDAYCGRPRLSHEICIDGSYADFSLERLYPEDSPLLKAGLFELPRKCLAEKGMLERADVYFRNSCEWMRRVRKFTFEKLRAADRVAGYDFLGDINTHWHTFGYSVGMMDEFYRLKPGETVGNVLRYNSAAVLLADFGSDFVVTSGVRRAVSFSVSNYDRAVTNAILRAELAEAGGGRLVWKDEVACAEIPNGKLSFLGFVGVQVPTAESPVKYILRASIDGLAANEWEIYAFPPVAGEVANSKVRIVADISKSDLMAAMEKGERVLLLGAGPFKSLPTTYRIGMAGRCQGTFATVVKQEHPALAGMPRETFCGWQFRRMMEGGRAVQLEAGVPFDPIIDLASSVKFPIRQASLFEYRIGKGRLLVCSFNFGDGDLAAAWLKSRLAEYAASNAFCPPLELSPAQLRAVIDAPLLDGGTDRNRARNPHDPSGKVRADDFAQP